MRKTYNAQLTVDTIYETIKSKLDLFQDPSGMPHVTIHHDGKSETVPTHDIKFQRYIARNIHNITGKLPLKHQCGGYRDLFEDDACNGPTKNVWVRCAIEDNVVYIDLANDKGQVVKISAGKIEVISQADCPVTFYRTKRTRPLPTPDPEGSIEELYPFFHFENPENIILLIAALLKAMIAKGATPLISITGEQGSGKSVGTRSIKDLIDPTSPAVAGFPSSERNFYISAMNCYALAYDNLSFVCKPTSDMLCTIITGAGFSTRKLHTDTDEILFDGKRVIILNGIPSVLTNPDVCQRSIFLEMAPIPTGKHEPESILMQRWNEALPRILGGFYKAISVALQNIETTKVENYHRMADFERWVIAAITALPFTKEEFKRACSANRQLINDEAIEADPVATAITMMAPFCPEHKPWQGTATQLIEYLANFVPSEVQRSHEWPSRPNKLTEKIRRATVFLRERSIHVEFFKSGERYIKIYTTNRSQPVVQPQPQPALEIYTGDF